MTDTVAVAAEAFANAWLYGSVLLIVGVCATQWWLRLRVDRALDEADVRRVEEALATLAFQVGVIALAAFALRGWTHTFATFGWEGATSAGRLQLVLGRSLWGRGWQKGCLAAAGFAIAAFIAARRTRKDAWWPVTAAGLALCGALPLMGHAAGSLFRIVLHGAHVLGSGLWLGTLTAVMLASRAARRRGGRQVAVEDIAPVFLSRFSPIAVSGVAILLFAGAGAAFQYFNAVDELWTTGYGQLLCGKLVAFAGAAFCGWWNFRGFRAASSSRAAGFRTVTLEVGLAVVLVVLTSFLTETAHPFME